MDLVATIFDRAGLPVRTERVHLNVTRIDTIQITHLRLGLEVTYITGTGQRIDYRAAESERALGARP